MPKNLKLKEALNRHKGVDHKLDRQKKLQKEAEKRKRVKRGSKVEVEELEAEAEEDEDLEAEELATDPAERKREKKSASKAQKAQQSNGEADGWETDESEDGEENEGGVEVGAMEDESDSDSEAEFQNGNGDDDEEDIPLSDIESLASEDRGDVIPHQRLTINNTAALQRSLKAFALPSTLPFSATQSVTSAEPVQIADVEDDLNRELAFYRQSLDAVTEARAKLKKEGVPFTRPTDYFAEMVKSEEQMGKVRSKLLDETARKKASADARRQRDLKKFGKAVQVAKLQERQKETSKTLDRIQTLKRSELI
jgi:rRNA-processing protein EBP2